MRSSVACVFPVAATLALAGCDTHRPRFARAQPVAPIVTVPPRAVTYRGGAVGLAQAAEAQMVTIPASRSIAGSTEEERALAYEAWSGATGSDLAKRAGWFDREEDRHVVELPAFRLDLLPVTNAAYAEFVADGGAPAPTMDEETWAAQGFQQPWADAERAVWRDGQPPAAREDHPVVLVSWDDAAAYCAWRGQAVGAPRRLPGAHEFEKAARGDAGLTYPWGPTYDASKLNAADSGANDTVAVGSIPDATSPYGVLDLAGNVFQWTSTRWPPPGRDDPPITGDAPADEMTVKGSAWDDHPGLGRGAAWHGRPRHARHILIGFRCAG